MDRPPQTTHILSLSLALTLGLLLCACDDTTGPGEVTDPRLVRSVSAGNLHTCAITGDGDLYCWGYGGWGQLGDGDRESRYQPVRVQAEIPFVAVSAGSSHTCALTGEGEVWCWGQSGAGALGDGTTQDSYLPVQVESDVTFTSIFAGGAYTCALASDGAAYCWGDNGWGQLGDGTTENRTVPTPVLTSQRFKQLSASRSSHTCGITRGGQTLCWGSNRYGEIGDGGAGEEEYRTEPTEVSGSTQFAHVYAGSGHTCALTGGGTAYCWGGNSSGDLGDESLEDRAVPGSVSGSQTFTSLTTGGHVCGLTGDGVAYCWGSNSSGQVGVGSRATTVQPTHVATSERFSTLAAGGRHTCGVTPGGALFCWGDNESGQLGDGGLTRGFMVPVAVWRW